LLADDNENRMLMLINFLGIFLERLGKLQIQLDLGSCL